MFEQIRSFFAPPVFEEDEDKTHLAKLIHQFALAISFGTLFFYIVWAITSPELAWRLVYGLPLFPLAGAIFVFLHRKDLKTASWIIVVGIWVVLYSSAIFNGGIHAPAMGGHILVVLMAALLLGRQAAIGFAALSIVATLGLVFMQGAELISGERFTTPMAIWASYTTYLIVAGTLLHIGTNNIQEALARARKEISERKRVEEALREAEIRYRTLLEKLPVVTYRATPNREGSNLYISPQIEHLVGYSPEAWVDNPALWQELLHPEDYDRVMANVTEHVQQGGSSVIEYRLRTQENEWVWVRDEAEMITDENGTMLFIQGTLSNITDRILAAEALRASEEKFNKAFYYSPFPVSISSPTQGYIEVNEAFLTLLGRDREEIIGQPAREVGLWFNEEERLKAVDLLLRKGWLRDFEFRFQKKSGEVGVGLTSAALIPINGEQCALSSIFDLTQRKQAEEALLASEEKFQKAFQASPIAMAISSPTRGYLDINEAFMKIIGYSREETIGHFSADIGLWMNKEKHREALELIQTNGELRNFEIEYMKKTGELGVALASAVVIDFEDEKCILASFFDITDRKHNEEALRASEEKFQKAFLSSPVSMLINSPSKGILNVNRAFEELTGFQRADVLGRHAFEVGLWVNPEERQESIDRVRKQGNLHDFEIRFRKKDGQERVGSLAVDLVDIENEKCYLASFQDITSRKEAEETLRNINAELEARVERRTAQLEAANRELESFTYSVSHDLRSPLRAINGFSSVLLQEFSEYLPPEAQRLQNYVQKNALKMGRLIDDLLAFSRLGRSPLQRSLVQTEELVADVWNDLEHDRVDRQIDFSMHPLKPCHADPNLLRQVFANLLDNAIKFTRPKENAFIEIGNRQIQGREVYYVKDNGAGFDMAYANKLFGVFQRLHHESEFEGTGVGLATVQRIVHRHGGEIWAESEPNKGATFFFTLPAS